MRKFLLLCSMFFIAFTSFGQKDTLYYNSFQVINDTNRIFQDTIRYSGSNPNGVPPRWALIDTFGYNSDSSYQISYKPAGHVVILNTEMLDATGKPYINLSFWHIAKLHSANRAYVKYSIDGGNTFQDLPINTTYQGDAPNYGTGSGKTPYFNQISYYTDWAGSESTGPYSVPMSSWWKHEEFDLSGVLSDLTTNQGFDSIIIQFETRFQVQPPLGTPAGWFVDDILITAAPCELNKPRITFANPQGTVAGYPSCFVPNPEGGLVELASTNYPISARVKDDAKSYDSGVDTVMVVYQVNGGVFDTIGLDLTNTTNQEYRCLIPSLAVGDNVNWYMLAYDFGCPPNEARMPSLTYNNNLGMYSFFIEKGLPGKCDAPNCGNAPNVIRTFPWTEDFEDNLKWTSKGSADLGVIPTGDNWYRAPSTGNYGVAVNKGTTPSPYTGPSVDHTKGDATGKYLYLEAATGGGPAYIQTPCIDLTNATGCLGFEFYYHMYGSETGNFKVYIDSTSGVAGTPFATSDIVNEQIGEHQLSSNEPWQRAVFSLNDYMGKYIRIRITFRPGSAPLGRSDMAVDDLRIFYPNPVDVEVIDNPEPKRGYCDYAGRPIDVVIRNNGCNPLTSAPLKFKLNSSATVYSETATFSPALALGDSVVYTFNTHTFPTIAPGIHQLTVWSEKSGDANLNNDTAVGAEIDYHTPISTFPLIEDFEAATVGTQNLGNTNWFFDDGLDPAYKWTVHEGMTDERSTGPYTGYHYEGKYLYASGASQGLSTYLRSKCLDFGSLSSPALYFYYHMFGADIDNLKIQVSEGDEPYDVWTNILTISGSGKQSHERDDWRLQRVNLSTYAGKSIKLRFVATRKGATQKTHLAIDKIMIFDEKTADAGAFVIDGPKNVGITAGPSGTNDPKVTIANFGSTTLTSCTVHFKITLKCDPSVTNTYSQYFSGLSIAPGSTQSQNLSAAGVNYPIGAFSATTYTSNPNGTADTYNFNDTISRIITGGNNFYDIPWKTDFDTCDYDYHGFIANSSNGFLQWELGKPNSSSLGDIKTARSGSNAWVTRANKPFLVGVSEELRLPTFEEFDTVKNPQLRFYMNLDFPPVSGTTYNTGLTVRFLNGASWDILGENNLARNLGTNWLGGYYASPTTSTDLFGGPGWVHSTTDSAVDGWIPVMYPLNAFSQNANAALKLRFEFKSTSNVSQSVAGDGAAIDDFEMYIPPQNSVSPVRVTTVKPLPVPGFDEELDIRIRNTGQKTLDSCMLWVTIDGQSLGPAYWEDFNGGKLPGGSAITVRYNYIWPAADVTSGDHEVCVIAWRPQNKPDQIPFDDTLCVNLPIMLEVDMTHNPTADEEYCDNFDDPNPSYTWLHRDSKDLYSADSCWEKGFPSKIGAAHSGNNAWMTKLTGNYDGMEQASLFTPIFDVDTGIVYQLNFWHWLQSERYHDGGNVEYSFDGGLTWYPIGYVKKGDSTWYNTPFVTALDQIRGGWTDSTAGWEYGERYLTFGNTEKVIFRFRFGSDYDIDDLGWAIDDFCFRKDTSNRTTEITHIGQEEIPLPENAIVGEMVPNPASDHSQLSFVFPTPQDVEIRVHNIVGQVMETRSAKFTEGTHTVDFNTTNWAAGVYFVNFEYGGKLVTRKLVVK